MDRKQVPFDQCILYFYHLQVYYDNAINKDFYRRGIYSIAQTNAGCVHILAVKLSIGQDFAEQPLSQVSFSQIKKTLRRNKDISKKYSNNLVELPTQREYIYTKLIYNICYIKNK